MYASAVLATGENGEPPSSNKNLVTLSCPWEGYDNYLPVLLRPIRFFSLNTNLSAHFKRVSPV